MDSPTTTANISRNGNKREKSKPDRYWAGDWSFKNSSFRVNITYLWSGRYLTWMQYILRGQKKQKWVTH